MRLTPLALLLTGCALAAPATLAWAQEPPTGIPAPVEAAPVPGAPAIIVEGEPGEAEAVAEPAAPAIPEIWAPVPTDAEGRSAYGLYLSGRLAGIRGDRTAGAELLAASQALTPEQPVVGDEAFRAGLFSGDLDAIARLTPIVRDTPLLAEAGRLVELIQTLRRGDAAASLAMVRERPFVQPYASAVLYVTPAIAAAAGDWDTALAPVTAAATDDAGLILRQQRAQALESRRRFAEADAEYAIVMATPRGGQMFAIDYGEYLERRGRRDEALAVYQASLGGSSPDPHALSAVERLRSRGRAPAMPTAAQNAATALQFAARQTSEASLDELSAIYLRLSYSLNPTDETAIRLGHALAAAEQEGPAREAFARVGQANPIIYAGAQYNLGLSLQREGRSDEALAAFQRADASAPGQMLIAYALLAQLNGLGRHEEALVVLNRPDMNRPGQPAEFHFQRGAALESLGRLDEAENELWAALQAQPDDPTILNYLGYLWVDSGRRVQQGAEMLARAHAADPQNGNIQDSLGWAQFRQGQYEAAVQTLEEAVGKLPGNAEIVDHLGDAYWQVGRRREAEWQWSRVLTLDPEPERRAEVEQKLERGLSEPTPVSANQS